MLAALGAVAARVVGQKRNREKKTRAAQGDGDVPEVLALSLVMLMMSSLFARRRGRHHLRHGGAAAARAKKGFALPSRRVMPSL
jgi:hypothetical protein